MRKFHHERENPFFSFVPLLCCVSLFQTLTQREKREKLQEKRKALLEVRLAKVRERKLKQKPQEASPAGSSTTTIDGIADFDFDKTQSGSTKKAKEARNEGQLVNIVITDAHCA